jgi:hypothetical protein
MVVKWEGEEPPDKGAWIDVLREALGETAGSCWVRFYREPGGWRFDLEYRQASRSNRPSFTRADESTALRVYTLLVEVARPRSGLEAVRAEPRRRRSSGRRYQSSPRPPPKLPEAAPDAPGWGSADAWMGQPTPLDGATPTPLDGATPAPLDEATPPQLKAVSHRSSRPSPPPSP